MKIAYLILAHKNIGQLSLLIDLLTLESDNFSFIHLDAKCNKTEAIDQLKKRNVSKRYTIINNSFSIKWGGFSMIEATLALIDIALKHQDEFDYFSLNSGFDMPLKSNEYINNYLVKNRYSFFLEYFNIPNYKKWPNENGGLNRVNYYWFVEQIGIPNATRLTESQKLAGFQRGSQCKLEIYGGSQWWTISRECARYVLDYVNDNNDICDFFKYCLIPDEFFFNTIIANSKFRENGKNDNLRYIDFGMGRTHPKVFLLSDFDQLIGQDSLYARKFDITYDIKIFSKIINYIENYT